MSHSLWVEELLRNPGCCAWNLVLMMAECVVKPLRHMLSDHLVNFFAENYL